MGGQFREGGLHQPPFPFRGGVTRECVLEVVSQGGGLESAPFVFALRLFASRRDDFRRRSSTCEFLIQKIERPVGVPAARAWGMEGT